VSSRRVHLFRSAALALGTCAGAQLAAAQYPGQITKPKNAAELRSVAVLEWTGDEHHPKASRVIPVSVFDGQQLEDGGLYLARPEPLALESEVEYQLKRDGQNTGLFVIESAALEQGSWVGHGSWKPLPKPKTEMANAQSWKVDDDVESDRPVLHRKAHPASQSGANGSGSASQGQSTDPDRPTLHRSGDSSSGDSNSSNSAPAPDPDRPTLHRSTDDQTSTSTSSDANQPKPKKRNDDQEGYVSYLPDVTDPDRPRLIPGKPTNLGPAVLPSLTGLPADMQQTVAVSDSNSIPEHIWSYSWANPDDEARYKTDLEQIARQALGLMPPPAPSKPAKKNSSTKKTELTAPPPPEPLVDERFRVFELAYSSGATMVLSARTGGTGADEKFVTLIAQPDLYGNVVVLVKNLTDAAHLDQTPRMKLIDAVDAMADNRGELLFELRGATQRQFALYRVLRGQATELFVSGGNPIVTAGGS
jgi:hypothetical protein